MPPALIFSPRRLLTEKAAGTVTAPALAVETETLTLRHPGNRDSGSNPRAAAATRLMTEMGNNCGVSFGLDRGGVIHVLGAKGSQSDGNPHGENTPSPA